MEFEKFAKCWDVKSKSGSRFTLKGESEECDRNEGGKRECKCKVIREPETDVKNLKVNMNWSL